MAGHTLLPPAHLGLLDQALASVSSLPPVHLGALGGSSYHLSPLPFTVCVSNHVVSILPSSVPQSCVVPHSQRRQELPGWDNGEEGKGRCGLHLL